MKVKKYKVFLIFLFSCCFLIGEQKANFAAGQETATKRQQRIEKIRFSKKIRHGDLLLASFLSGEETIRVIVKLSSQPARDRKEKLQTIQGRDNLRQKVRQNIDTVIDGLDQGDVHIQRKFAYENGFAARVSLSGLEDLLADNRVYAVFEDRLLQPMTTQGLSLMQGSTPRARYDGSGIAIAVLDTGVDYNHPMLGGGGFPNSKVIGGVDIGDDDFDPFDAHGHGTACAGIAAGDRPTSAVGDYIGGVAPGTRIYAVKISHSDVYGQPTGEAWTSDILEALEWCITHQYDAPANPIVIANISFGLGEYSTPCDSDPYAEVGVVTIENANFAGISLFASSGNNGYAQSLNLPACYSGVISVGAVYDNAIGNISFNTCTDETATDKVACYSNSASNLDLLAPSHNVYTTDTLGSSGGASGDYKTDFGGTSASSPYGAGSAAVIQEAFYTHRGTFLSPDELRAILITSGDLILDQKNNISKPRVNLNTALTKFLQAGDINGDGVIDTGDAIDSLKLLSNAPSQPLSLYGDINKDSRLGFEETVYSLRYAAELVCMEGYLNNCTTEEECEAADGFWHGEACYGEPFCDAANLALCDSERACDFTGGYWLISELSCVADPTVEIESNNTKETANPLYLDVPVTASLTEATDEDWFALVTNEPLVGHISFSASVTSTFWFIAVHDANGNMLSHHDLGNNDSSDVALPGSGIYYFSASVDSTHLSDPYTLQVSSSNGPALANIESEPNNTQVTADSIILGESMTGQLMEDPDEDWFRLEVATATNVNIVFSTAVASTYWLLSVYDANENLIAENNVGNNGSVAASLSDTGSCFIRVKKDSTWSDDAYSLSVTAE